MWGHNEGFFDDEETFQSTGTSCHGNMTASD
jgi:hypothetical protein